MSLVDEVAERLEQVRSRIAEAASDERVITIVAVTKGFGVPEVEAAAAVGLRDVAENYSEELMVKHSLAKPVARCRWHFLGRVQRAKVRRLAGAVSMWQSVDRLSAGCEIAKRAPGARVLVQVNVSGEPHRNGCRFEDADQLVGDLRELDLDVRGLMAVGVLSEPDRNRRHYRQLGELGRRLDLAECSMGMTDDIEVAVEEGATMVRVGRALFGPRSGPDDLRR